MIFEQPFRTRGYEVDHSGALPLSALFSYFEHTRWEWMHTDEMGLRDLLAAGHFFVVREQAIGLREPIDMRRDVIVTGALDHVGRSEVRVRQSIRCADNGAVLAEGRVVGIWLSPARRMTRVPESVRSHVVAGGRSDWPVRPSETAPPVTAWRGEIVVRPSDCDRFEHVNAGAWARFVDDARLASGHSGRFRCAGIRYLKEAVAGEGLVVRVWPEGDGVEVQIERGGDIACRARVQPDYSSSPSSLSTSY